MLLPETYLHLSQNAGKTWNAFSVFFRDLHSSCSCINGMNALKIIYSIIPSQKLTDYSNLLTLTNHVLIQCYIYVALPTNLVITLLMNLRALLHEIKVVASLRFMEFIEKGLILYIEDESKRFTDSQYNDYVCPLLHLKYLMSDLFPGYPFVLWYSRTDWYWYYWHQGILWPIGLLLVCVQ